MDDPAYYWNPTFNPENMFFYTGDKFPSLKGSLLIAGASKRTAQMIVRKDDFVRQGGSMLEELNVRFRDIRHARTGTSMS